MGQAVGVLGLVLALVFSAVAITQVNALQDVSKPLTTGTVNEFFGSITLWQLLLTVVVGLGAIAGMVGFALRR